MPKSNEVCEVNYVHKAKVTSARKALLDTESTRQMAETFGVLSDPTRLKICLALSREELCVCDIATLLAMSVSAISHQLSSLKHLRLVKYRKEGKMTYYSLVDEHIEDLLKISRRHGLEK
ncbi:MAG: metalloregulator ArsR/SmtB family transcription factor [bacterium]